jgi:hypothetical protein
MLWGFRLKHRGSYFLKQCPFFPFCNTILVWGAPLNEFSLDSLIFAKSDELSKQVFTIAITLQGFNLSIEFEFYNNFEGLKVIKCLGLEL